MAEYQMTANGNDEFGHSFLPEFKRAERFAITMPYDITPQDSIDGGTWTDFMLPSIYDRILSVCVSAPVKSGGVGPWTAEKMIDEVVISSGTDNVLQRITQNYIRFWYQGLDCSKKNTWDKMTSAVSVGEYVYIDIPMAAFQCTAHSIVPWGNIHLHIKWSSDVGSLIDVGELTINTRNVILDENKYKQELGENPLLVMEQVNDAKQLIIQSHEQIEYSYENSSSVQLELRGPCKDIWFGLKANADFSAHTIDISTADLYRCIPYSNTYTQPHQSSGVVRLTNTATGPTITSANLKINDDKLFEVQREKFFNQVVPYYRYRGCAAPGYYFYSFALTPQEFQPSGTFNFSRITNKFLNITNDPYESTLHVISNRYNVTEKNVPLFLD